MKLVHARLRRRFSRGLKRKPMGLIKKLRKAKKEAPPNEKPAPVKTHLRDMPVVPEMIGSVVGTYLRVSSSLPLPSADIQSFPHCAGVYNGKSFVNVEIRGEMVGHYLAEFAISYTPSAHGRPGLGSTAARFIPLK